MTQQLPLTGLTVGAIPPAVLLCGDPERATFIAALLDEAELLIHRREYRIYHGRYQNVPVAVASHGIGAPGAAIAFEELIAAGARCLVRIGTCGGLQPEVQTGDLVIATAAVQNTGYGRETVPDGYPCVADPELTLGLRQEAAGLGYSCHAGIVLTRDNFYKGVPTTHSPEYAILSQANVVAVEMECAALFIVGSLRRVPTAAILAVDGNVLAKREDMARYKPHQESIQAAVKAGAQISLNLVVKQYTGS